MKQESRIKVGRRDAWLSTALLTGLLTLSSAPAQAQQLITNGGFESAFAGWTRVDQTGSDGSFLAQTGTSSPINAFPVPAPPQGTQAAMTDAQGPGSHVLFQDFTVPAGTLSGTVGFSLFINSGDTFRNPATLDFSTPTLNQQARVDIITTGADPFSVAAADVLQNLFQTIPTDPVVSGYTTFSVNVSSLLAARQGQTLRLRFAEVDNVSFFNLGVDQVSIVASPLAAAAPEPESLSLILAGGNVALLGLACRAGLRRRRSRG